MKKGIWTNGGVIRESIGTSCRLSVSSHHGVHTMNKAACRYMHFTSLKNVSKDLKYAVLEICTSDIVMNDTGFHVSK